MKNQYPLTPLRTLQYTVYAALGGELVFYLVQRNWVFALVTALNFPVIALPAYVVERYQLRTSAWFVPVLTLFIFLAQFLGSTIGFYIRFHWWDDLLHFVWGMLSVVAGFVLLQGLKAAVDGITRAEGRFFALFAFSFSLMTSAVWEVFEFAWDTVFGTDAQQGGWPDTMIDLTTSTIGALLVLLYGYHFLHMRRRLPFIR